MESADTSKIASRQAALTQWLRLYAGIRLRALTPIQGDASMRHYYRVETDTTTYIAMDAPPPQENCRPFVVIAKALRGMGLNAPEIIAAEVDRGFLLLTDFGDMTYLKALQVSNADRLYEQALEALSVLQGCRSVPGWDVPRFADDWMWREWQWHQEWFLGKLLALPPPPEIKQLDECYAHIVDSAVNQPQVFMHRDFHSANLMLLPKQGVGILDFQDAFIGPITYDLVSLLRDCYIDWPEQQVTSWALLYLDKLKRRRLLTDVTESDFLRWFDLMGLERHLKALFTFARKQVRDQQPAYLKHIPRTLDYVLSVSRRYPELAPLHQYMMHTVHPAVMRIVPCEP